MDQNTTVLRRGEKSRRRWPRWLAGVLAVALVAALAWNWPGLSGNAKVGAAYGARIACSCRFIAGRELDDCRKDFPPGLGLVRLSEGEQSVTGSVPVLASETARFEPGRGCTLDTWER